MTTLTKTRAKEYRRALASLSDDDAGTALACFVFSSLPQKLDNVKALRSIEGEPGFKGWGRFVTKPRRGPHLPVPVSRSDR